MAYLLDANVFIAAKNLHYGLDFCPAFWDWLIAQNSAGLVFSIERVGDEVQAMDDDLSEWARLRGDAFFLKPDAALFPALTQVSGWDVFVKRIAAEIERRGGLDVLRKGLNRSGRPRPR